MENRIGKMIEVYWQKLKPIQPEDSKIINNIESLKESIRKYGFSLPFAVWENEGDYFTIDGHTRVKALNELKGEGVEIPNELPGFEISAKDKKEAIAILVEVFNQKHNAFDNSILVNWLEVEQVEIENLNAVNTVSLSDDLEYPDDFTDKKSDKSAVIKITFESIAQLQEAENDIQELIDRKFEGAYYSVSAGEL